MGCEEREEVKGEVREKDIIPSRCSRFGAVFSYHYNIITTTTDPHLFWAIIQTILSSRSFFSWYCRCELFDAINYEKKKNINHSINIQPCLPQIGPYKTKVQRKEPKHSMQANTTWRNGKKLEGENPYFNGNPTNVTVIQQLKRRLSSLLSHEPLPLASQPGRSNPYPKNRREDAKGRCEF